MDSSIPSKLRRGFRWLVSASLIAALFWWVDMTTLIQALVGAQPILLLVGLALCVSHRILMSVRWKMILAAKTLTDENSTPTENEIRQYLSGNFCRCTGYVKIIEAVQGALETGEKP